MILQFPTGSRLRPLNGNPAVLIFIYFARTLLPLLLMFFLARPGFAQVQFGGTVDFEFRDGGPGSRPLLNGTPTSHPSIFIPAARLFASADLGERWWVQAALLADYYGFAELSSVRFSQINLNWQPWESPALMLQAGRFVTPFGLEMDRYIAFENPFVHQPLLLEWSLRVDPDIGYFDGTPSYDAFPGQSVVYARMYTQGIAVAGVLGTGEQVRYTLAAALGPASSYLEAGYHDVPSFVGRISFKPTIWSRLGASGTYGSHMRPSAFNDMLSSDELEQYRQAAISGDLGFNYRYLAVNAQYTWSRWSTLWLRPSVETGPLVSSNGFELLDDDVELALSHFMVEAVLDLPFLVGSYLGGRFETAQFESVNLGSGDTTRQLDSWMPDLERIEAVAGYRITRNVRAKASYAVSLDDLTEDRNDAVFALQISVLF